MYMNISVIHSPPPTSGGKKKAAHKDFPTNFVTSPGSSRMLSIFHQKEQM